MTPNTRETRETRTRRTSRKTALLALVWAGTLFTNGCAGLDALVGFANFMQGIASKVAGVMQIKSFVKDPSFKGALAAGSAAKGLFGQGGRGAPGGKGGSGKVPPKAKASATGSPMKDVTTPALVGGQVGQALAGNSTYVPQGAGLSKDQLGQFRDHRGRILGKMHRAAGAPPPSGKAGLQVQAPSGTSGATKGSAGKGSEGLSWKDRLVRDGKQAVAAGKRIKRSWDVIRGGLNT